MVTVDRLGRLDPPPPEEDPPVLRSGALPLDWHDDDEARYAEAGRTLPLAGGARHVADGSGRSRRLPTRLADPDQLPR